MTTSIYIIQQRSAIKILCDPCCTNHVVIHCLLNFTKILDYLVGSFDPHVSIGVINKYIYKKNIV